MGFNSSSLDNIVNRVAEVVVFSTDGYEKHMTPEDAAKELGGVVFRKYIEGQKIRCRWRYDYHIGAHLLEYVNYGNGYKERWDFIPAD